MLILGTFLFLYTTYKRMRKKAAERAKANQQCVNA